MASFQEEIVLQRATTPAGASVERGHGHLYANEAVKYSKWPTDANRAHELLSLFGAFLRLGRATVTR